MDLLKKQRQETQDLLARWQAQLPQASTYGLDELLGDPDRLEAGDGGGAKLGIGVSDAKVPVPYPERTDPARHPYLLCNCDPPAPHCWWCGQPETAHPGSPGAQDIEGEG